MWVENQTPLMDIGQLKQTFELNNECFQLGIIKGPTNVLVIQKHFIFTWPYTIEWNHFWRIISRTVAAQIECVLNCSLLFLCSNLHHKNELVCFCVIFRNIQKTRKVQVQQRFHSIVFMAIENKYIVTKYIPMKLHSFF